MIQDPDPGVRVIKEKQVVAKRGCTCCGTGCVLILGAVPLTAIVLWETVGAVVALSVWPLLFVGAHLVRHLTGHPKKIIS